MASPPGPAVRVLNVHQGFICRHSGACCSAGWDIAVGPSELARIVSALDAGLLVPPVASRACARPFVTGPELPEGAAAVLTRSASGECVFFEAACARLCAIQRVLGHSALPSACRHFPRILLTDAEEIAVTLSHVCPTAAGMLFREDVGDLAVVADPDALSGPEDVEGFDARETIPPFVKPGVVFDADSRRVWERFLVSACNHPEPPEQVIARMARGAERLRDWTPVRGTMADYASGVLDATLAEPSAQARTPSPAATRLHSAIAACLRPGLPRPAVPDGFPGGGHASARGAERVIRRYLGARAFAAWSAYLGEGVRTQMTVLAAALAVLRMELTWTRDEDGAASDSALRDALQRTDRIVVHHLDEAALCRQLGTVERLPASEFLTVLGVGDA